MNTGFIMAILFTLFMFLKTKKMMRREDEAEGKITLRKDIEGKKCCRFRGR